ncbi:hypothetical protein [Teredinibacter waterburyi]|uniref:hypothetical protein n=1 Tax=Teredinibacter waterburyi TaxID=1500538 RepID=UPI00165F0607|nr:hypothetical protein [Teredinibacter waterburyi]
MIRKLFIFIAALSFSYLSYGDEKLPDDVLSFTEKRDGCDHFRGEEPYDEGRRQSLEENMIELCTGTDAELSQLKEKYKNNASVTQVLSEYETNIEP